MPSLFDSLPDGLLADILFKASHSLPAQQRVRLLCGTLPLVNHEWYKTALDLCSSLTVTLADEKTAHQLAVWLVKRGSKVQQLELQVAKSLGPRELPASFLAALPKQLIRLSLRGFSYGREAEQRLPSAQTAAPPAAAAAVGSLEEATLALSSLTAAVTAAAARSRGGVASATAGYLPAAAVLVAITAAATGAAAAGVAAAGSAAAGADAGTSYLLTTAAAPPVAVAGAAAGAGAGPSYILTTAAGAASMSLASAHASYLTGAAAPVAAASAGAGASDLLSADEPHCLPSLIHLTNLTSLHLGSSNLGTFSHLLRCLPNLQTLTLSGDGCLELLSPALTSHSLPELHTLDLRSAGCPTRALTLLTSLPSLRDLRGSVMAPKLHLVTHLPWSHMRLLVPTKDQSGFEGFCHWLDRGGARNLQRLEIRGLALTPSVLPKRLVTQLGSLAQLKSLDLINVFQELPLVKAAAAARGARSTSATAVAAAARGARSVPAAAVAVPQQPPLALQSPGDSWQFQVRQPLTQVTAVRVCPRSFVPSLVGFSAHQQ